MADLGRLEPFAMVSFRPGTAVHQGLAQGPLADHKAVVRTTLLKPSVLAQGNMHHASAVDPEQTNPLLADCPLELQFCEGKNAAIARGDKLLTLVSRLARRINDRVRLYPLSSIRSKKGEVE